MTSAPPVAQEGIDANIGAKNTETRNARPVTMAVRPVLPPSEIPVALSMKAVTGEVPMSAPILILKASTQYAIVEFSKSSVTGSRKPANLAMAYSVPVVSVAGMRGYTIDCIIELTEDVDVEECNKGIPDASLATQASVCGRLMENAELTHNYTSEKHEV